MGRILDGIEIPEDFDGIDDDIALGLMEDHGLINSQQKQVEATTEVEPTEKEPVEEQSSESSESESESTEPVGEPAPVKEQETGKETTDDAIEDTNEKTVPYQAMLAERNKRKKEQSKNEALQAELAQLRAQYANPTQVQQPVTQPPVTQQISEQTTEQQQAYDEYIEKSAVEMFVKKYEREPDELSRTDTIILGRYAAKVEDGIQKYQEQQKQAADAAQRINQSYRQFVKEQQNRDEYDEIVTSFVDEIKSLPPEEQEIIKQSFQQCESGKGTQQDVYLVRKIWGEAAKKIVQPLVPESKETPKEVVPPKPAKTAEQKLEQMEKHPKSNLVTGNNASTHTSIDEIARLMREMPWSEFETKYPQYAKLLLEG